MIIQKSKTLIHDPAIRAERTEQKKQLLLEWLVDFTWTTPKLAGLVMGVTSRSAINKTLSQLEAQQLIKTAMITPIVGREVKVLGITPHGVLWSDLDHDAFSKPVFDQGRVAISTMQHKIDVQLCRLKVRSNENFKWLAENNYPKNLHYRPDAIITSGDKVIALELERTAKTRKRYQQLVVQHLRQINQGFYQHVHYVSTIEGFAERLNKLFDSITKVPVKGQQVLFSDELKKHFKFHDINHWRITNE